MTLWKQGASAVRVLARLRLIFGSAGIGIGGVLPIGTALVTEFAPRRILARVNINEAKPSGECVAPRTSCLTHATAAVREQCRGVVVDRSA